LYVSSCDSDDDEFEASLRELGESPGVPLFYQILVSQQARLVSSNPASGGRDLIVGDFRMGRTKLMSFVSSVASTGAFVPGELNKQQAQMFKQKLFGISPAPKYVVLELIAGDECDGLPNSSSTVESVMQNVTNIDTQVHETVHKLSRMQSLRLTDGRWGLLGLPTPDTPIPLQTKRTKAKRPAIVTVICWVQIISGFLGFIGGLIMAVVLWFVVSGGGWLGLMSLVAAVVSMVLSVAGVKMLDGSAGARRVTALVAFILLAVSVVEIVVVAAMYRGVAWPNVLVVDVQNVVRDGVVPLICIVILYSGPSRRFFLESDPNGCQTFWRKKDIR